MTLLLLLPNQLPPPAAIATPVLPTDSDPAVNCCSSPSSCLHPTTVPCQATDASWFLTTMAADPELAITVAMMADAGDEVMQLTRRLDADKVNVSKLHFWVSSFLDRIRALF